MRDNENFCVSDLKVAVLGLGYVGLPLAAELGKFFPVVGFDINEHRISQLQVGYDATNEILKDEFAHAKSLSFTSDPKQISDCNFFIVTVPTPIDENKSPDLEALIKASETVGTYLKEGDYVVYESTVYPGCTEERCVPVLEHSSGLILNTDFYVGYSPERINPGDRVHRLTNIKKITSGSTPEAASFIDQVYSTIISAGTFKASNIRVAEAAKVIENTQRDVNIALMNELAILFNRLGLDTAEVLEAAGTKWNFLPFRPGLVGGHCIGVDPYYLAHKAQSVGYNPEIIMSGRRLNDNMPSYVGSQLLKALTKKHINIWGSRVLVMGLSFKENCPDVRNSKVIDIVNYLKEYEILVDVYDPWVNKEEARTKYGLDLLQKLPMDQDKSENDNRYDAIVLAVAHEEFKALSIGELRSLAKEEYVLYDIKSIIPPQYSDLRL